MKVENTKIALLTWKKACEPCFITNPEYFKVLFNIFRMWQLQASVLHWWGKDFFFELSAQNPNWFEAHVHNRNKRYEPIRRGVRALHFCPWDGQALPFFPMSGKPTKNNNNNSGPEQFLDSYSYSFEHALAQYRSLILKIGPVPRRCIANPTFQTWSLA